MREIKFRAIPMNGKGFVYGDLIHKKHGEGAMIEDKNGIGYDVDEDTIGQFTGVYDKNGNEIYEGDIVRASINLYGKKKEIKYEVKFDDDIDNDSFGQPLTIGYCLLGYNFEVIGNIYDNKDLMMKDESK